MSSPASARSAFDFHLPAASDQVDTFRITNNATTPLTVQLYAVNARTTSSGVLALASRNQKKLDIATWIKLDAPAVTIPATSTYVGTFRLSIPPGVPSGDYSGGIIAELPPTTAHATGPKTRLQVVKRYGITVRETVPGTPHLHVSLLHSDFSLHTRPTLHVRVTNTGNITVHGSAHLQINTLVWAQKSYTVPSLTLLPGQYTDLNLAAAQPILPIDQPSGTFRLTYNGQHMDLAYKRWWVAWRNLALGLELLIAFGTTLIAIKQYGRYRKS